MYPFKHLLSEKHEFFWGEEMQKAFEMAKFEIVKQAEKGVKCFRMDKETAIVTDWSKKGIGYLLLQKFCGCQKLDVNCCKTGW